MPIRSQNPSEIIENFEKILSTYYKEENPLDRMSIFINHKVDEYNIWIESETSKLDTLRKSLEKESEIHNSIKQQIDEADREIKRTKSHPKDSSSIHEHNQLVSKRNKLVQEYNERLERYEKQQEDYNSKVETLNREIETRKSQVDKLKEEFIKQKELYEQWMRNNGPEKFWNEVNTPLTKFFNTFA